VLRSTLDAQPGTYAGADNEPVHNLFRSGSLDPPDDRDLLPVVGVRSGGWNPWRCAALPVGVATFVGRTRERAKVAELVPLPERHRLRPPETVRSERGSSRTLYRRR
jgi:hypothetical protein